MYLRTIKRRNADGTEVVYYQLAENIWDSERGCAVAKVIYSFGRADELDPDKLRRLARSILRVVDGIPVPLPSASPAVKVHDAWPVGGVFVLEQLWRELGIDAEIGRLASARRIKLPVERALFAMVANRALCPYSKLYCWSSGYERRSTSHPAGTWSCTISTGPWTSSRTTRPSWSARSTSAWRT
jgi:hypothetical protein